MFSRSLRAWVALTFLLVGWQSASAQSDFRVAPYVQNPALDGMTVIWFSEEAQPGELIVSDASGPIDTVTSTPESMPQLAYPAWELVGNPFPGGVVPDPPFRHLVRLDGLVGNTRYSYRVRQGASTFESSFRTAPGIRNPIRFMVYGDSETEPNPREPEVLWADPTGADPDRRYLIDQRTGYAWNVGIMREREPDFIAIAGDLVESGGEQRDWDEFWRMNTNPSDPDSSLASSAPIIPVPGNHEYYSSPHSFSNDIPKEYRQPWSEMAMDRYSAYFDVPENGSPEASKRYFRLDYGPVAIIAVDVSNNGPNQTIDDTNFKLLGDADTGGGGAPSFHPGSPQYEWLEEELAAAQNERPFVFVLLHYAPYSVGPHGWPAGEGDQEDPLSGVPVRTLTPLFMQYGVDAVFAGHDEMWERSVVEGLEQRPDGSMRDHAIHFYDLGTGGDGLRGPQNALANPFQRFLAHLDAPEQWSGEALIDGGKHYGHLEVEVEQIQRDVWQATLTPVFAFPLFAGGSFIGSQRRTYDDVIVLMASDSLAKLSSDDGSPEIPAVTVSKTYPNPTRGSTELTVQVDRPTEIRVSVYDVLGRRVSSIENRMLPVGRTELGWDGKQDSGEPAPTGTYLIHVETSGRSETVPVVIIR